MTRRGVLAALGTGATASALGGAAGLGAAQSGDRTLPWLYRDGNEIKDPEGNRVVLHGVNVTDPARGRPKWGHMHTEDAIAMSSNPDGPWNSRVIRLPMQPQDIGGHGPGSVEAPAFDTGQLETYCEDYVDSAVQAAREHGQYIMLDYHRHYPDGPDWDTDAIDTEIRTFWNVVADRYGEYSHVIFELYNEPNSPYPGAGDPTTNVGVTDDQSEETWLKWKETAQPWVNLIREYAQDQLIVIGSPRWSQWTYWAANSEEFEGENLAYAGHVYAHENMRPLSTYFGEPSTEVPVFMSEYGWEPAQEAPYLVGSRDVEGEQFRQLFENYPTIHTQAWCFDHSWTPNLLEKEYEGAEENYLVRDDWGAWTVDFLADRADTYLPQAPSDAGPVDPGEQDPEPEPEPPTSPGDQWTNSVTATSIEVGWSSASGATSYELYRDGTSVGSTQETTYTFTGLSPETEYAVGVRSVNDAGRSDLAETTVTTETDGTGSPTCEDSMSVGDRTVCNVDDDGLYEDFNADGELTHADVQEFFGVQHRPTWKQAEYFDFNENEVVGHGDVTALFEDVATGGL